MALQTTLRKTLKYGINLAAVLDSVFAMVNAEIIMVHFFYKLCFQKQNARFFLRHHTNTPNTMHLH